MLLRLIKDLFGGRALAPEPAPGPATIALDQTRLDDAITLIVPSVAARAALFRRTLEHLAGAGVSWPIMVTDHSEAADRDRLDTIAAGFPGLDLRVVHHEPALPFLGRLVDCARRATTPYVVLHADDDFLVPPAVEACVDFLEGHLDHTAAKGQIAFCTVEDDGAIGASAQEGRSRPEPDVVDRMLRHIASFNATLYAVHRREAFVEAHSRALAHCENVIFWQYLASCWTIALGKLATLDGLYYVRENNPTGWRGELIRSRDRSHWPWLIVAPDFSDQLGRFKDGVSTALASVEEGRRVSPDALDEACMFLVRRAMGGDVAEARSPGELALAGRLEDPASPERRLIDDFGSAIAASRNA